jgi:hypothetical protein
MTQSHKHVDETGQTDAGDYQEEKNLQQDSHKRETLSLWQTLVSVGQASFGVQNQKNKERDFEKGSITGFIAAALIFTVLFVVTLVVIVNVVLG